MKLDSTLGWVLENYSESSHGSYYLGQWAIEALQDMPLTEKAQNSLLYAALRDKNKVVRIHATEILGGSMLQALKSKVVSSEI